MSPSRLLAVTLVTAGLSVTGVSTSAAAAETCQGHPATVVGYQQGQDLKGTPGDDVIVTNGANRVWAGAGNDLICVTGTSLNGWVDVRAEEGDDTVDVTAHLPELRHVSASLGAGTDAYVGSAVDDEVDAQDANGHPEAVDTVSTGAGSDTVKIGRDGVATLDVVLLGDGDDEADVRGLPGAGGHVDGGVGTDTVFLADGTKAGWKIDNRAQTMTARSAAMPTTGLEEFRVFLRHSRSVHFLGGRSHEMLQISLPGLKTDVDVDMGGGRDVVDLWGPFLAGRYDGGRGADELILFGHFVGSLESAQGGADLTQGLVWMGHKKPRDHGQASVRSFAGIFLDEFGDASVVGDSRANDISIKACRSTVTGGAGDDSIVFTAWARAGCGPISARGIVAFGEEGNDDLLGSLGRDLLDGGSGRDRADGSKGIDSCRAEVRRRC